MAAIFGRILGYYVRGIPVGMTFTLFSNYTYSKEHGKPELSFDDPDTRAMAYLGLAAKSIYYGYGWPSIPYHLYKDHRKFMTLGATYDIKVQKSESGEVSWYFDKKL